MSTPPKRVETASKAARTDTASVTSHWSASAAPPIALAILSAAAASRSRTAISAPARLNSLALAELGLLERPVFDVEEIVLRDRFEAADRLGAGNRLDRAFGEIGGDLRIFGAAPETEQAEPGHQDGARHQVELALPPIVARVLAHEIGVVIGGEFGDRAGDLRGEAREAAGFRRRQEQWVVLGADRMVRRRHARLAVARERGAVDIGADRRVGAEIEDEAPVGAGGGGIGDGAGAADDRRDLRRRGEGRGQGARREDGTVPAGDALLGERDHRDHPLIGFARGLAEGEDAVLQEDQPLDGRIGLVGLGRLPGEGEARHDVGHEPHAPPVDRAAYLRAVWLVGEGEHRGRMRVVDVFMRQEGVQQRLDRRVGRAGVDEVGALEIHHVLVAQAVAPAQPTQRRKTNGGQAGGLDLGHVPAAALDAEHLDFIADEVGRQRLHRGIAAAMENEAAIAAEQPRGIDAQGKVAIDAAPGVVPDDDFGIVVRPLALHRINALSPLYPLPRLRGLGGDGSGPRPGLPSFRHHPPHCPPPQAGRVHFIWA
jgi:hypothetical protein